jgi:hypothetical protein
MTPVLLVMLAITMSQAPATAQSASPGRETPLPPSITGLAGSEISPSTMAQHGPLDQELTSPCSLHVPDILPQPSGEGEAETPTGTPFTYAPLSAGCKFKLFLATTYSPYTFVSAGFEASEAQATGQWPHYGGGMQG